MAKQADEDAGDLPNNVYVHNNARFLLFDCFTERESLIWLRDAIKQHKPGEVLFFCTHIPVVPYNARANWMVYVHPEQVQEREELLNLLGAHKAIVLSGHLHKTSVVVRSTPLGELRGGWARQSLARPGCLGERPSAGA